MKIFTFKISKLELSAIVLCFFLLVGSTTLYIMNISTLGFLFGWTEFQKNAVVGELNKSFGDTKRKLSKESSFLTIPSKSQLFNYDTIVTDKSGAATLMLEDGSTISLGENTMIKLAFQTDLSLQGISRFTTIEVISGKVSGKSKKNKIILKSKDKTITLDKGLSAKALSFVPPSISTAKKKTPAKVKRNVPVDITYISPANGEELALSKGNKELETSIDLKWEMTPENEEAQLVLNRVTDGLSDERFSEPEEVLTDIIRSKKGTQKVKATLYAPGRYEWSLRGGNDKHLGKGELPFFFVDRTIVGIKPLAPLVSGEKSGSNRYSGDHKEELELRLRWKKYPDVENYTIKFFSSKKSKKPFLVEKTSSNSLLVDESKLFTKRVYYQISSPLPDGFKVISKLTPFQFKFLPPSLILPKNNSTFTRKKLRRKNNKILLTWQKTNFTKNYEFELAESADFSSPLLKLQTKENFIMIDSPKKEGAFWWRVRSLNNDTVSAASKPNQFMITLRSSPRKNN